MEGGFVKLSRKLTDWGWYDDPNVLAVWIHILMMVNWKDGEYRGMKIKPGQKVTSIRKLAEDVGLPYSTTRKAINKLESTHEITTERHTFGSLITVVKWADYQQTENEVESQRNHEGTTKEPQGNHQYRRRKEGKKERREIIAQNSEPSSDYARNYTRQEMEEIYDRYFGKD